jgi:hypothetical protein
MARVVIEKMTMVLEDCLCILRFIFSFFTSNRSSLSRLAITVDGSFIVFVALRADKFTLAQV